jgi:hypothetical protein
MNRYIAVSFSAIVIFSESTVFEMVMLHPGRPVVDSGRSAAVNPHLCQQSPAYMAMSPLTMASIVKSLFLFGLC